MSHFRLHGNCFIVKGANRALIYDVFRSRTLGVSLKLAQLYESEFLLLTYQEVLSKYAGFKKEISRFVESLIEQDFGWFTDEPECFPPVNTTFDLKKRIYSAVIELDTGNLLQYERVSKELTKLDCSVFYLLVREGIEDIKAFGQLLASFKESRATWVQVIFDQPYLSFEQLKQITHDMRITYKIFRAHKEEVIEGRWWFEESIYKFQLVEYKTEAFNLYKKSQYGIDHFWPTQSTFIESQGHNPFFNHKVCISKNGELKNDLAFDQSFGNVHERSLKDLIRNPEFKKIWYLSNDKIEKCKDCQFRYQCISNSDIKEEKGKYYKVHTCTYDPWRDTWL